MNSKKVPGFETLLQDKDLPASDLVKKIDNYIFSKLERSVAEVGGDEEILQDLKQKCLEVEDFDQEARIFADFMDKVARSVSVENKNESIICSHIRWIILYRVFYCQDVSSGSANNLIYNICKWHYLIRSDNSDLSEAEILEETFYDLEKILFTLFRAFQFIDYFEEGNRPFNSMGHYLLYSSLLNTPQFILDNEDDKLGAAALLALEKIHSKPELDCNVEYTVENKEGLVNMSNYEDLKQANSVAKEVVLHFSSGEVDKLVYDPADLDLGLTKGF